MTSVVSQDIRKPVEHRRAGRYAAGIYGQAEGFEPYRNEMVFERTSLSTLIDAFPAIIRSLICAMLRPVTQSTKCWPTKTTARFEKYPEFMETYLEPPIGSNRPYLASSVTEKTLVANSEARLHAIFATLEECRAGLLASTSRETAELVSVAILEFRMKLHRISDFGIEGAVRCNAAGRCVGGKTARPQIAAGPAPPSPAETGQIASPVRRPILSPLRRR